jgi:hypothetical protein
VTEIKKSQDNMIDLIERLGEVGIDTLIDDGILRDIPIIGSMVGILKLGKSISDSLLGAKVKRFIENLGSFDQEEINEFNQRMEDKTTFARTSRMILQYVNSYDSEQKAEILGYVFGEYIRKDIDEETFKKFASLIGSIYSQDLKEFVLKDGNFDWQYAHEYIAHGLVIFQVPKIETLGDIMVREYLDQTGMTYSSNPWGAEVVRVLTPFFTSKAEMDL